MFGVGSNMARMIAFLHLPGFAKLIGSKFFYKMRHIIYWIPLICNSHLLRRSNPQQLLMFYLAPATIVSDSMYRIRAVSAKMLEEKLADAAQVNASDTAAKRDIMSLLIRARIADKGDGYHMSDQAMMDQVLTFLGRIFDILTNQQLLIYSLIIKVLDMKRPLVVLPGCVS